MVPQSLGHLQVCTHAIIYDENGDMLACAVSNSFMIASVEVTEMWTYQLLPRETLLQLLSLLAAACSAQTIYPFSLQLAEHKYLEGMLPSCQSCHDFNTCIYWIGTATYASK